MLRCEGVVSQHGFGHLGKTQRKEVRVLPGTVPGRHLHDPHAPWQPLLRHQPHRSLFPYLSYFVSRLLSARRVR